MMLPLLSLSRFFVRIVEGIVADEVLLKSLERQQTILICIEFLKGWFFYLIATPCDRKDEFCDMCQKEQISAYRLVLVLTKCYSNKTQGFTNRV